MNVTLYQWNQKGQNVVNFLFQRFLRKYKNSLIKQLLDCKIKTGFDLQTPCRLRRQLISEFNLCFASSLKFISFQKG